MQASLACMAMMRMPCCSKGAKRVKICTTTCLHGDDAHAGIVVVHRRDMLRADGRLRNQRLGLNTHAVLQGGGSRR